MILKKNTAGQKIPVYAWDTAAGAPYTGGAATITAHISIDGVGPAATNDVNPTELHATDAPGIYIFDLTQAETNGDMIIVSAVSSDSDVTIMPLLISTTPTLWKRTA